MKLILKIATVSETKQVQLFFGKYIKKKSPGITSEEFLCPFGVSANIKRGQVIILKNGLEILGALRFYPRKIDKIVSVYQFALNEKIRGKGLLKTMLKKTGYQTFEANCFINDKFNEYYKKTGWKLIKSDDKLNYWEIDGSNF